MVYSRFKLSVVVQVLLILLACVVVAYLVLETGFYATIVLVVIVIAIQVGVLVQYVQRTNRDLRRFLLTIEHSDFSQTFTAGRTGGGFARLSEAFERVLERFRETRSAKEEQASYLHTLVQHVPIAVIAVDPSGNVDLFNNASRRLFGVAELRNLRDLESFEADFADRILRLSVGRQELIKVRRNNELLQLNASATELRMRGRDLKIVTLQDIRRELEARELEAWQNLIRVLTHEIMNSITPISSLAATARELLDDAQGSAPHNTAVSDAKDAVDTIAQRGTGLIQFVDSYRRLTRLPTPTVRSLSVADLFSRIAKLMAHDLEVGGVELAQTVAPEAKELVADPGLLEQALINLVRNAIDALAGVDAPQIDLTARVDAAGRYAISVRDNGPGMADDVREHIFVPFYTTKREGTGVGLSVVQQIMRSHHGAVEVASAPGGGTEIRLVF